MKKIFLIIILLLSILATPMAFAIGTDSPSNATPNPSPSKKGSNDPVTGFNTSLPSAERQIVRERIVVHEVPAPHPPTKLGHHTGVGHEPVYKKIKKWNPASVSFTEARDKKLAAETQTKLNTEKAERLAGDSAISSRVEKLEEKKDKIRPGIYVLIIVGIVFLAGLARQQEN